MTVPLAVVHGAADPFIKLDTVDGLKYSNLWRGKCIRLEDLGHSPLLQGPDVFLPLFDDFMAECSAGE
jgi:pimeloyl-ACP methyl ester carboxylesterase